jgi:hypothetical protein
LHGTPRLVAEYSDEETSRCEQLLDSGEDADIGLAVTLAFSPRAVIAEEGFDALSEVSRLLMIDVDDEGRAFAVAIVDDERELAEVLGAAVIAKMLGNEVGEIGE